MPLTKPSTKQKKIQGKVREAKGTAKAAGGAKPEKPAVVAGRDERVSAKIQQQVSDYQKAFGK